MKCAYFVILFGLSQFIQAAEICNLTDCYDPTKPRQKTPYEKVMDQRRMKVLNQYWQWYIQRNQYCMSEKQLDYANRAMQMASYPNIQSETTPFDQVTATLQKSATILTREMESEITNQCDNSRETVFSKKSRVLKNLDDLQSRFIHVLEDRRYWLQDKPEYMRATAKAAK